jgi:hypothetical protein
VTLGSTGDGIFVDVFCPGEALMVRDNMHHGRSLALQNISETSLTYSQ